MTDPESDYLALGRALAAIRSRTGHTQEEAGAAVGVGGRHVSMVEQGKSGIAYPTMMALLRVYGASLVELAAEVERG